MLLMALLRSHTKQVVGGLDISNEPTPVLNGKYCGSDGKWRKCRAQFSSTTGILHIQFEKHKKWSVRRDKRRMAGSIKQELAANSHAVIYMRDYGWNSCCHSVAVVPLVTGTLAQISIFSSQSVAEIKYLGQNLQDFCNVATFKVEVEDDGVFSGPAFLHVLQDRIILSVQKELKFICYGPWPIQDCSQLERFDNCLLFKGNMTGSVIIIRTSQSGEIYGEFLKRLCVLNPLVLTPNESSSESFHKPTNQLTSQVAPPVPGCVSPSTSFSDNTSAVSLCLQSDESSLPPIVPERCPLTPVKRNSQSSTSSGYEESENSNIFFASLSSDSETEKPPERPPKPRAINEKQSCKKNSENDILERTHYYVSPPSSRSHKNLRHHSDSEVQSCNQAVTFSESTPPQRHQSCPRIDFESHPQNSGSFCKRDHCSSDIERSSLPSTTTAEVQYCNQPKVESRCYVYTNLQQPQYANVFYEVNNISYVNWQPELLQEPERPPPVVPPRKPCPPIPPRSSKLRSFERKPATTFEDREKILSIYVAVFASQPVAGRTWFLRVAFIHKDDTTWKTFKELEKDSNHELKKVQVLEVRTDIQVALSVPSEFELTSETCLRDIDLQSVKSLEKGKGFVIEFSVLDKIPDQQHEFLGKITVGPKDNANCLLTNKIEMGINEVFERKDWSESLQSQHEIVLPQSLPTSTNLTLNYRQRLLVCQKLDVTSNPNGNDWRLVASRLEFTNDEILRLEDKSYKSHTFSPMKYVLNTWEQRDPSCSVDRLVEILHEVERTDIVQDLEKCS